MTLLIMVVFVFSMMAGFAAAAEEPVSADPEDPSVVQEFYFINPAYEDVPYVEDFVKGNLKTVGNAADPATKGTAPTARPLARSAGYESNENKVIETIRNGMVGRVGNLEIKFSSSFEVDYDIVGSWIEKAMDETDSPVEGDYLRLCLAGSSIGIEDEVEEGTYYTTISLDMSYYTTAEQEDELTAEFDRVIDSFGFDGSTSDYDKVEAIYNYITGNVTYDYDHLNSDDYFLQYSAYAALINKTAVCQGYASLLYRMLRTAGLDSRIIVGDSFGVPHAWNIVKLDGVYYLLDSTWDAGCDTYTYFLKGSSYFPEHTCDSKYSESGFTSRYPISTENYPVPGAELAESDGFRFQIQNKKAKVVKYLGSAADVTIPAEVGGCPVTTVGSMAFYECSSIKKLTLSEGIKTLEQEAIAGCENLKEIYFPSTLRIGTEEGSVSTGVTVLPNRCTGLEQVHVAEGNKYLTDVDGVLFNKELTCIMLYPSGKRGTEYAIPEGVRSIGSSAFEYSQYLEKVTMPDTVGSIGYWAFNRASKLKEINISENCTSIGQFAFSETRLTSLHIPAQVEYIDLDYSFLTDLKEWTVASGNQYYCAVDGVLFDKDMTVILHIPAAKTGAFEIPSSVGNIASGAAEYNSLSTLTIPSQTSISDRNFQEFRGDLTFYGYEGSLAQRYAASKGIKFVSLGTADVVEIASGSCGESMTWSIDSLGVLRITGSGVMWWERTDDSGNYIQPPWGDYRNRVEKLIVEEGPENIAAEAFDGFTILSEVSLPSSIRTIEGYSFAHCTSLKELVLPEGLEVISGSAFESSKIGSLTIPSTLREIGEYAFMHCSIGEIKISPESQYFTLKDGAIFNSDGKTLIYFPKEWMESYYVPDGVETIAPCAFSSSMIDTLYLPDSVKNLGRLAFYYADIKNLYLGDGIETLPRESIFCVYLESLVLGNSVRTIEERAVDGNYSLKNVYYKGTKSEWDQIDIGGENTNLFNNEIKYAAGSYLCEHSIHKLRGVPGQRPTCNEPGYKAHYECTECGKIFKSYFWGGNSSYYEVRLADLNIPPAHSEVVDLTPATLTEDGYLVKTCSICGKTLYDQPVYHPETFSLSAATYVYNGRVRKPAVKVTDTEGNVLLMGTDYTVTYAEGRKDVGKYTVTVKLKGKYTGTKELDFVITKAANKITKVTSAKTIKYAKLKKKNQAFKITASVGDNAKKTFTLKSVPKKAKKYIKVSSAGNVTIKKRLKKGTYKIKVQITAEATKNYKKTATTKTIKIVVK